MIYTFDLTDKVVLITGGYGYLGKAVTESLLYHGAKVCVLGRSAEKFNKTFESSALVNPKLFFEECDISDTGSVQNAFESVFSRENRIDALINNAFYLEGQDPLTMSDEEWASGIEGTLGSVFRCIREVIPYLKKSRSSTIINVSSMYGMTAPDFSVYKDAEGMVNPPHYGAAKAGVHQLSKYYASYLGKEGITVNTVSPGSFPPPAVQENSTFIKALNQKTLLKRIGKPEDLGGAFVYLVSDASNYMTGQNIVVDGGWTVT